MHHVNFKSKNRYSEDDQSESAVSRKNSINVNFENFPQVKALRSILDDDNSKNVTSLTNSLLSEYLKNSKLKISNFNNSNVEFEFVLENQRGMKFFGIPAFSHKSLFPLLDPPSFQSINGTKLLQAVEKGYDNEYIYSSLAQLYPLPDLDWEWTWDSWYVFMLHDVDDQGWIYSRINFGSKHWKGKYNFGNFIRRRIWVRLRNRKGFKISEDEHGSKDGPANYDMFDNDEVEEFEEGDTIYVGSTKAPK
ncbi:hypothetical protein CLIB1423_09S04698 [[Candida] railenensis]|uniref:Peroxin/Ferlin domain-containing protein n=1 Tax=[Candida] railenensis TaxID=45579 RepID=A0A9P0QR83_9ASCO|nr:hypothetical protein CLIB1423_09S04698 [[Candida] railenensis]